MIIIVKKILFNIFCLYILLLFTCSYHQSYNTYTNEVFRISLRINYRTVKDRNVTEGNKVVGIWNSLIWESTKIGRSAVSYI